MQRYRMPRRPNICSHFSRRVHQYFGLNLTNLFYSLQFSRHMLCRYASFTLQLSHLTYRIPISLAWSSSLFLLAARGYTMRASRCNQQSFTLAIIAEMGKLHDGVQVFHKVLQRIPAIIQFLALPRYLRSGAMLLHGKLCRDFF